MNESVKVSIIVPVYNVSEFLPRCLESCINQTLYDIEIICVNDGSTDSSRSILKCYEEMDWRIVVIDQKNGGLSCARNTGLKNANGEWIMFLDSDDYLAKNACERIWAESKEAPNDIITFGGEVFPKYNNSVSWYEWVLHTHYSHYNEFSPDILFKNPAAKPFAWQRAYSNSFLKENSLQFEESLRYGEDMEFQMKAFPHAKHLTFLPDRLYHYRYGRAGSLMNTMEIGNRIGKHILIVEKTTAYWSKQGWLDQYGTYYLKWLIEFIIPDLWHKDVTDKKEYAVALQKIIQHYQLNKYKHRLNLHEKELLYLLKKCK